MAPIRGTLAPSEEIFDRDCYIFFFLLPLSAKLDNPQPPSIPKQLQTSLDGLAWAPPPAGYQSVSRILSVVDETEDEDDTICIKPKMLPSTPSKKQAFRAVKKSLFKGKVVDKAVDKSVVIKPVCKSVTLVKEDLIEVVTCSECIAPPRPPG